MGFGFKSVAGSLIAVTLVTYSCSKTGGDEVAEKIDGNDQTATSAPYKFGKYLYRSAADTFRGIFDEASHDASQISVPGSVSPTDDGECTPEKVRKDPYHPDCAMR